jgi:hypothetical protein
MNNNPAKYLDKILKILSKRFGTEISIQEIQNELTPITIFGEKGNVTFSIYLLVDSQHAIDYLLRQNMVVINPASGKIFITYEGYMKIKTKGFAEEVHEKRINLLLQRIAWTIPLIISSIALWVSLSKDSKQILQNTETKSCNKIEKASQ